MKNEKKLIEKKWFEEDITDDTIKSYLNYVLEYKRWHLSWYIDKRKKARNNSWKHLLPALIFFGMSLIFPLLVGIKFLKSDTSDLSTYYALGYISLILSTLLLLADRLFIHSKSWIRYTITLNQLESISSKYYSKWIILLPKLNSIKGISNTIDHGLYVNLKEEAITLLFNLDKEVKEVIKTETDNWRDLFTGQLDEFNKQASSRLESMESEISSFIKEEKTNTIKYFRVNLEIELANITEKQKVNIEILKNNNLVNSDSLNITKNKWAIWDMEIGVYLLVLKTYENEVLIKTDNHFIELVGDNKIHKENL